MTDEKMERSTGINRPPAYKKKKKKNKNKNKNKKKKNYGIIIKDISKVMYTVWHVDKYKITFKLVMNHWTNEIL